MWRPTGMRPIATSCSSVWSAASCWRAPRSRPCASPPERPRKLLLHRRELDRIAGRAAERGLTLVPTRIYFSGPHAKAEIALARGKDLYDKRQSLRDRDSTRDIERGVREAQR